MLSQTRPAPKGTLRKAGALLGVGLVFYASLGAVVALAVPQKAKKPTAKSGAKAAPKAADTIASMTALGKKVYASNGCNACHTISGKGGPVGPDLTKTGANAAHTVKWLSDHVANPKTHTPTSSMPAFASSIKGKDLVAVGVYLKTLGGKPEAADIGTATAGGSNGGGTAKAAPADPAIVAKIEKAGGSVREIAQSDPRLDVDFHLKGSAVTDAAIAPLAGLKNVLQLHLGKTSVTDAGLAYIKGLKDLTDLHLEETKITDRGLVNLKELKKLEYLNLYGTAVTDAGLTNLTGLTNLKRLYVWQTKVTPTGVEALKKSLPKVEVVMGWDTAEQKK
jgi:cbb3-type cytochrome oxidase cytochrome c subunit